MSSDLSMVEQRDRFLSFAFAASDLLIEVDTENRVVFAAGSTMVLTGRTEAELIGLDITELAHEFDCIVFREYLNKLRLTGRAPDRVIGLLAPDRLEKKVSVSGMGSTQRAGILHLAMKRAPLAALRADREVSSDGMETIDFANSSALFGEEARESDTELALTMYDVGWDAVEGTVSSAEADELNNIVIQTLRAWASENSGVGEIGSGKYSLLLEEGIDPETLSQRIKAVAHESHSSLDLDVHHASLAISDLVDTDDFADFFERAMGRFDELGGEAFDLQSFKELPPKVAPESDTMSVRDRVRRR